MRALKIIQIGLLLLMGIDAVPVALGEEITNDIPASVAPSEPLAAALTPAQWTQVESCVDRALAWIATQQAPDGSFPPPGPPPSQRSPVQVGVGLSFPRPSSPALARTEHNSIAPLILSSPVKCLTASFAFATSRTRNSFDGMKGPSYTGTYNHAIAGLMLGVKYLATSAKPAGPRTSNKPCKRPYSLHRDLQTRPKEYPNDRGGWRYLRIQQAPANADSDLSVTGWQLMFLRSARNAEFKVPQQYIDDAMDYIHRTWDDQAGMFRYEISASQRNRFTRGLMGSAILSLALGGQHQSPRKRVRGGRLVAGSIPSTLLRASKCRGLRPFFLQHLLLQPGGSAIGGTLLDGNLSAHCRYSAQDPEPRRLFPC